MHVLSQACTQVLDDTGMLSFFVQVNREAALHFSFWPPFSIGVKS